MDKKDIPVLEDSFFAIRKIEIKEHDVLLISITFYGGCKEHLFRLFGFFEDDNNIVLLLEHNANGDQCKSILHKDLTFNLSPIKANISTKNKIELIKRNLILNLKNLKTEYEIKY